MGWNDQLFSKGSQSMNMDLSQCGQWGFPGGWEKRQQQIGWSTLYLIYFYVHSASIYWALHTSPVPDARPVYLEHRLWAPGSLPYVSALVPSRPCAEHQPFAFWPKWTAGVGEIVESETIQSVLVASGWPRNWFETPSHGPCSKWLRNFQGWRKPCVLTGPPGDATMWEPLVEWWSLSALASEFPECLSGNFYPTI